MYIDYIVHTSDNDIYIYMSYIYIYSSYTKCLIDKIIKCLKVKPFSQSAKIVTRTFVSRTNTTLESH